MGKRSEMVPADVRCGIELAIDVCRRPGMFLPSATFDCVVSFLDGFDRGTPIDSRFLQDFEDWLRDQLPADTNAVWPQLIVDAAGSSAPIDHLRKRLEQFLSVLDAAAT